MAVFMKIFVEGIPLCYQTRRHQIVKGKGKGKAFPLQAWTGLEGSRRLRFPDSKTIGT